MRANSATISLTLLVVCTLFVGPLHALKLTQGTFSVGGHMSVPYTYSTDGRQNIAFREEPILSFFVLDNLRLVGSFEFEALLRWSKDYPLTPGLNTWGGKLGAEYVFALSPKLFISTGLRLGLRAQNALFSNAQGLVELPLRLWWEINENAAIEVAFPSELALAKEFGFESFSISAGYFGVVAFF